MVSIFFKLKKKKTQQYILVLQSNDDIGTALLLAILFGRVDLAAQLLQSFGADANELRFGRTALHLACLAGNASAAKLLLVNGADVNRWDSGRQQTALHYAAWAASAECCQLLLRRGAHVNAGIERRSALHMAVEQRAHACVESLIKAGANPNTPQVYTETPLHTAAAQGDRRCVELLLDAGADVRSQHGKMRQTALHLGIII